MILKSRDPALPLLSRMERKRSQVPREMRSTAVQPVL
jgi:hypothetical protein